MLILATALVVMAVAIPASSASRGRAQHHRNADRAAAQGSHQPVGHRRTALDTVEPTLDVTSPAPDATVSGTVKVSGTASDDTGVWKVRFGVDSEGRYRADGTTSWSGSLDTTKYSEGSHLLTVKALDRAGNFTQVTFDIVVNNSVAPSPDPSPTGRGTVWGIYADPRGSLDREGVISELERLIGRRFGGERIYTNMVDDVPGGTDADMKDRGWVDYHNINPYSIVNGKKVCVPLSDIAAGRHDGWWIKQAQSIKAWGYPMYLSFAHEPSVNSANHPQCGTAPEFRAAYDHLVQLFDAQGVTNVTWVWTLTASTFNGGPSSGGAVSWEPAQYDVVGVDGYNREAKWRSPEEIFQAAIDFAKSRSKPLLVGEIASDEQSGNPSAKANWITGATDLFKSYGDVIAVMWSHTNSGSSYWMDSSPQALSAFTGAGHDPYFNE